MAEISQHHDISDVPRSPSPAIEILGDGVDGVVDESDSSTHPIAMGEALTIKPRPYQKEMLEESLKRNIIVAMDTGSGKTQVAIMRMMHELEHMKSGQLIWFLAPTVSLCSQQFASIKAQITSVQIKLLSGADQVDLWTQQSIWDAVLKNVKIVVSTYDILNQALTHGFVRMESLALIVFDEAHNCVGRHAGAKIMQLFYHRRKAQGLVVPHILGLTASPAMRSKTESLTKIKATLDSICRYPSRHRAELRSQVKLPVLSQLHFESISPDAISTIYTESVISLGHAVANLKLSEDPYYLSLLQADDDRSIRALERLRLKQNTWTHKQLKAFYATSQRICGELGGWAADYYIAAVIDKATQGASDNQSVLGIWDVSTAEKEYLAKVLRQVYVPRDILCDGVESFHVTDKVNKLFNALLSERSEVTTGIIFVKERATGILLSHLISIHPFTRGIFRVETICGTSSYAARNKDIGNLVDMDANEKALSQFKSGETNLVVATSVLEEGIDVPACNLVICFEKPANLKSFVQRRGRARHENSRLILLLDTEDDRLGEFEQCEREMRKLYEDEMQTLQALLLAEDNDEDARRFFTVEKTGAMLELDNAVAHLYHFCATLPTSQYVDLRPDFICSEDTSGYFSAKVILPVSVHESVRTAQSRQLWRSEKNAIKDAAFECYVALYNAQLISDNLLPLYKKDSLLDDLAIRITDTRASMMTVHEAMNPWSDIGRAWQNMDSSMKVYSMITSFADLTFRVLLPCDISTISSFPIYWDPDTPLSVDLISDGAIDPHSFVTAQEITSTLLQVAFGHRMEIKKKDFVFPVLLDNLQNITSLAGRQSITEDFTVPEDPGLIRDKSGVPHIFRAILPGKPAIQSVQNPYPGYDSTPDGLPHISVSRYPRRMDFLHHLGPDLGLRSTKEYAIVLPASQCKMDNLPFTYVRLGLIIPSIMRRVEIFLVADRLSKSLLKEVNISNVNLIVAAICAGSANEAENYQKLEFIGDAILKLCTSIQLISEYPTYHEGYLSLSKDRIVSNHRLCKAAVDSGLDNFIITKAFAGLKWRPLYVEDMLNVSTTSGREMSSKTLADVIEALIGAAMLDGGFSKALACLQTFLPEPNWQWLPLKDRRTDLYEKVQKISLPPTLKPLEELLGYSFTKTALLIEAVTHASCNSGSGSLERLEFLGDSILDYIVVKTMSAFDLNYVQMHYLRTAVVNANFLAHICMEMSIEQEVIDIESQLVNGSTTFQEKTKVVPVPLWKFMRHMSPPLSRVQHATAERYSGLREGLNTAIKHSTSIPWALLARIGAQKFYSDMVESIIGAVWIDSGSFETCNELVERMGILPYLRRIVHEGVHFLHPKEELGMLADTEKVKYIIEKTRVEVDSPNTGDLSCIVEVGGVEIVRVENGLSKEEVQVRAAEQAIAILKARRNAAEQGGGSDLEMSGTTSVDTEVDDGVESVVHDFPSIHEA